jgi:hypothetical protein
MNDTVVTAKNQSTSQDAFDDRERFPHDIEVLQAAMDGRQAQTHTSMPGYIVSYNAAKMTATVQPAIKAIQLNKNGKRTSFDIKPIQDCPVHFPQGGGYILTFPVAAGDECLICFSERSIDNWFAHGGTQSPSDWRMHDITDAFVVMGVRSQKRVLGGSGQLRGSTPPASSGTCQLRSDDGTLVVDMDMSKNQITVTAPLRVVLDAPIVEITGYLTVNNQNNASNAVDLIGNLHATETVTADTDVVAAGKSGAHHVHTGIVRGAATTDPPQ